MDHEERTRFTENLTTELRVARARSRRGNAEIAERAGLSLSTVNRMMNGHRDPKLLQFLELCDALDADPLDLLGTVLARSVSEEGSNITPLPRIVSRQHHAGLGAVAETSYTELNEDDYTP
ncbi:MAG: helix-turn-helix transcriptional regulator [Pseudoclavibacter sp.]|nr:helix-turn-helix transcriptional regulator [Pseudoclavibacter sp.]